MNFSCRILLFVLLTIFIKIDCSSVQQSGDKLQEAIICLGAAIPEIPRHECLQLLCFNIIGRNIPLAICRYKQKYPEKLGDTLPQILPDNLNESFVQYKKAINTRISVCCLKLALIQSNESHESAWFKKEIEQLISLGAKMLPNADRVLSMQVPVEVVELFLRAGANPNHVESLSASPLQRLVFDNGADERIIQLLVNAKADVNYSVYGYDEIPLLVIRKSALAMAQEQMRSKRYPNSEAVLRILLQAAGQEYREEDYRSAEQDSGCIVS